MFSKDTSITAKSHALSSMEGSVRELWLLSFPLMLSLMSSSLMCFFDRTFLAHYSLETLSASVNAGCIASALQFAWISIASIAEIFVGQFNGAGRQKKIAQPVWQMIWLSLLTFLVYPALGFLLSPFLFGSDGSADLEIEYFTLLMAFGPFFCLGAALSCFYIGRGKVQYVTWLAIFANIMNVCLDYLLIFGFDPWIPEMGISGAALATGISQGMFCLILFCSFLSSANHKQFNTRSPVWNLSLFWKCLKVGFPNSLAHTIELLAWAVFFKMMLAMGETYITVVSLAQTIFFLFTFITEAVSKAASAIAANLMGSQNFEKIFHLFRSGVKFYLQMFLVLSVVLVIYPEPLVNWFLSSDYTESHVEVKQQLLLACTWVWVFFLFDGIHWLLVGLLTAAGDTKFVLKAGGTTVWLFAILPIYIMVPYLGYSADVAWAMIAFYGLINCIVYYSRLRSGKWRQTFIFETSKECKSLQEG